MVSAHRVLPWSENSLSALRTPEDCLHASECTPGPREDRGRFRWGRRPPRSVARRAIARRSERGPEAVACLARRMTATVSSNERASAGQSLPRAVAASAGARTPFVLRSVQVAPLLGEPGSVRRSEASSEFAERLLRPPTGCRRHLRRSNLVPKYAGVGTASGISRPGGHSRSRAGLRVRRH